MNRLTRIMFLTLATGLITLALTPEAAGTGIEVTANRDSIYLGESLVLTVRITGDSADAQPDLGHIRDCEIASLGSRNDSHYSLSIVNGKVSRTGFSGRTHMFSITPRRTGSVTLGPVFFKSGSRTLSAEGPHVKVTGIEEQDDVIVRVTSSRDTVLVDESFEVAMEVLIKCLPAPDDARERMLPGDPPHLAVPYLAPSAIDGLEHADTRTILQGMLARNPGQPGFTINGYSLRSDPFDFESMFNFNEINRERPAVFILPSEPASVNGQAYRRYMVSTRYTAGEEQTHTFGPVIFKGPVIDSIDQNGRVASHNVFAVGPSATVRVTPPPDEGRPDSFIGAIGTNMLVDASLDTQNCRVGDPLSLTLRVSGSVNLRNIYPPDLLLQTDLSKDFKIYDDTLSLKRNDDSVTFTCTVRPVRAGSLEFPPVSLSFFDVSDRTYRTRKTAPVPIQAAQTGGIDTDMILGAVTNTAAPSSADADTFKHIDPFLCSASASQPVTLKLSRLETILAALAPMLFICSLALKPALRLKQKARAAARGKSAVNSALKALRAAPGRPPLEAAAAIAAAVRTYAGYRFGVAQAALTPPEIVRLAEKAGLPRRSTELLSAILQRNCNAAFSSTGTGEPERQADAANAASIIRELEDCMKAQHPRGKAALLLTFLMLACAAADAGELESEADFLWHKAWSRTLSSKSKEEFNSLAGDYNDLLAAGVRNRYVLHNLGTALLLAGRHAEAKEALERSERYGGYHAATYHNMIQASEESGKARYISWPRAVFFWHYIMPFRLRAAAAVAAWTALFLIMTIERMSTWRASRWLIALVAAILMMTASSAITTAMQEHQAVIKDTYLLQEKGGFRP